MLSYFEYNKLELYRIVFISQRIVLRIVPNCIELYSFLYPEEDLCRVVFISLQFVPQAEPESLRRARAPSLLRPFILFPSLPQTCRLQRRQVAGADAIAASQDSPPHELGPSYRERLATGQPNRKTRTLSPKTLFFKIECRQQRNVYRLFPPNLEDSDVLPLMYNCLIYMLVCWCVAFIW